MTAEPKWISKRALLLIHEESLASFGGARGRRDEGLLDSAHARPVNTQAYVPASSLADLAASYVYGLARNHAFVDGNKGAVFLSISGHRLTADPLEAIKAMLALAVGELDGSILSAWIARNMAARG